MQHTGDAAASGVQEWRACHPSGQQGQHVVDLPPAMNQRRTSYRVLKGLPAYGPMAISFPESRAKFGREGFVVEFNNEDGSSWVGNFLSGSSGECNVMWHPDGLHVLVFAEGDLWSVDPFSKTAEELAGGCSAVWPLDSGDLLIQESGLYFFRLGREGIVWRTSRISWDGFQNVRIESNKLRGEAWSPFGDWSPETKRGWWRWILAVIIVIPMFYLLLLIGMGFMPEISDLMRRRDFDAVQWQHWEESESEPRLRWDMVDDLGITRRWINTGTLILRLDEKQVVVSVEVHQG